MDYKDLVVVGAAALGAYAGAAVGGLVGLLAGLVVGAGVSAVWAYESDVREYERRLESTERE
ncbi:hypothetical protein [Natrononativus amylolyticus]|uniref:hypothetical protein n=1 Tax=Natrononativus amylolyticus TaxID=2963434 RepID=UPI0020CDF3EB|nr:hypothetical protein [Natrononativus amylolyticus]